MDNEYVTMKEIGKQYGISSHKVGKELREMGYRDHGGQPTKKAYGEGLVKERPVAGMAELTQFIWHGARIGRLLEDFGYRRVVDDGNE